MFIRLRRTMQNSTLAGVVGPDADCCYTHVNPPGVEMAEWESREWKLFSKGLPFLLSVFLNEFVEILRFLVINIFDFQENVFFLVFWVGIPKIGFQLLLQ